MIPVRVFCQPCSLPNLPHVFPITLFVFSNSSHLEPRLVFLVPCVFKPQSVQTPAVRMLIFSCVPILFKPVDLRFLTTPFVLVPFGFLCISDSWFSTLICSWLRLLPAPWYFFTHLPSVLDFSSVFFLLFFCILDITNLCLPGFDICVENKLRSLHLPWSVSGSLHGCNRFSQGTGNKHD